jgi:3-phenylpropionate/cinnamic acid dioxygenase small subunit
MKSVRGTAPADSSTEDYRAIGEVIATYARALDTRDWNLAKAQFTDDAEAYEAGTPGPDAIIAFNRQRLDGCGATMHFLGHQTIRLAGDRAFAITQVRAFHVGIGVREGLTYEVMGEYHDDLVRTLRGWRIARRRFDRRLMLGDPAVLQPGT